MSVDSYRLDPMAAKRIGEASHPGPGALRAAQRRRRSRGPITRGEVKTLIKSAIEEFMAQWGHAQATWTSPTATTTARWPEHQHSYDNDRSCGGLWHTTTWNPDTYNDPTLPWGRALQDPEEDWTSSASTWPMATPAMHETWSPSKSWKAAAWPTDTHNSVHDAKRWDDGTSRGRHWKRACTLPLPHRHHKLRDRSNSVTSLGRRSPGRETNPGLKVHIAGGKTGS